MERSNQRSTSRIGTGTDYVYSINQLLKYNRRRLMSMPPKGHRELIWKCAQEMEYNTNKYHVVKLRETENRSLYQYKKKALHTADKAKT